LFLDLFNSIYIPFANLCHFGINLDIVTLGLNVNLPFITYMAKSIWHQTCIIISIEVNILPLIIIGFNNIFCNKELGPAMDLK